MKKKAFTMTLVLLCSLVQQPVKANSGDSRVDWKSMMTVAEVRRDTSGKLLPLQSYDETIWRGMSFLLDDHLKWFKGPKETITDENGHVQMPWVYYSNVQHNGAPFPNSVDRFVSYPAFHHSLLIRTFIRYSNHSGDGRALAEALKLADWNIAHSTPGDWAYGNLPYSTYQEKRPGGFRDKTGLMPDKAAIMALTYVDLYRATHKPRFLKAAQAIAQTLADRQRPNGTWPFRVDPKTEKVIEEYTSSVIYAVQLFESLDKINGNHRFRDKRDLTWHWLLNGPIKTKEFRGFYEDIVPSPKGRTNYDCLDTIRYLLAKRTEENGYLEIAKELNTWVEKIFLDKIKGFEPAEGIREQLQCNVVMGIHSLNWASMLYDLAEATGDGKMRKRAIQTANYITYYLQPDNRIVVGFQYHQWWYSCHTGVVLYLLDFVDEKPAPAKARKAIYPPALFSKSQADAAKAVAPEPITPQAFYPFGQTRKQVPLTGKWTFTADRENKGIAETYFAADFDAHAWEPVSIPCGFDNCGPKLKRYFGTCWFRRTFTVPETMKGQRVVLRFEGVNYNSSIWVNGRLVGENNDPFLPFEFHIEDAVNYGEANLLVVRVDNIRKPGQFPLFEGWYGQGGILREVTLCSTHPVFVRTAHISALPEATGGRFSLRVVVDNQNTRVSKSTVKVSIADLQGNTQGVFSADAIALKGGHTAEATLEGRVSNAQPWSPGNPTLYTARVDLLSGGKEIDSVTTRFGFRSVEAKEGRIFLNGKPIYLRGFNRHEDSPTQGMATDLQLVRSDLADMKRLGANFVRLCHYPHHTGELELCDELGLLVMTENAMNGWGWPADHGAPNAGFGWNKTHVPTIVQNARRSIREMVHRDYNHPSIILCSAGNESTEEHAEIVAAYNELIPYGRSLDPTRLWMHVSCKVHLPNAKTFYQSDDVIGLNCYPSAQKGVNAQTVKDGFPQTRQYWEHVPKKVRQWYPDKPIVITECGHPLPLGVKWTSPESLQAIIARAELEGITSSPHLSGVVLWHYTRHTWPADAFYAGGQSISPYGYKSRDRKRNFEAMAVIEEYFKKKAEPPESREIERSCWP